jgi:Ca2+/H+ antiporter, TMEM165/GDT1 family
VLEAFLVSTGIVALAEIGDKTQLLALILVARYRRATPIVVGILVATLANHGLAAALRPRLRPFLETRRCAGSWACSFWRWLRGR